MNDGCEDMFWYDCYWYNETCAWGDDVSQDWISGYMEGYESGFEDAVVDNSRTARDEETMTDFQMQLMTQQFETWV